jgi:pimeloyl-ACP methyl ester carboxylesterase
MRDGRATAAAGFLEVDGARLRFCDEGHGFAIVLIHGWGLDLGMWQPQVDLWRERFRVVRFDRRGFGLSTGRPSLASDLRDVETLLRRLKLTRVALIGMSQGARAALRVAAGTLRERVACLVLDGAPHDTGASAEPEVPIERYRQLMREDDERWRREWLAHPFMRLHTQDAAARQLLDAIVARYPAHDLRQADVMSAAEPVDLTAIRVPALVINGVLDTRRRVAMGDELARLLPRAERALIAHAGHLPNLDDPPGYARCVSAFVDRHADSDASR